jgi:hypothetical protein
MEQTSNIYDIIKHLELALDEGFTLVLYKYIIVKTKEILTHINKIEENLPEEIIQNKSALYKAGCGALFDYIEQMKQVLENGYKFFDFTVLNVKDMIILIDKIYAELPTTIQEVRRLNKS